MQIKILLCALLFFSCAEQPQDISLTMPDDTTEYEEPITETPIEETPTIETTTEEEMPKTTTTNTDSTAEVTGEVTAEATVEVIKENRIINATIQNELKAKERLNISFSIDELDAPESWTTCKIIDAETEKVLVTLRYANLPITKSVSFQAENERQIHKSFMARIEYYDEAALLLRSETVTIYAPIMQFIYLWQNREGKPDQGFITPKSGYVINLSTLNDRTGASDCAMRLVLRIPEGHQAVITKSVASIAGGSKPMSTHWRLADYNNKYRAALYPAPDDPLYHYDTDKSKWITDASLTLEAGFHVVHIVPDSSDFDDTELIVMVEHGGESYGISNYYIPENIPLIKELTTAE